MPSEWPEWPELDESDRDRRSSPMDKPNAEDLFAIQLRAFSSLEFVRQFKFAQKIGRLWRFDFAFERYHVAVEIDGVAVRRLQGQLVVLGRHGSIEGIRGDHDKLNHAALLGWHVLRFLQTDVKPRHAIDMTLRVLASRGWRAQP